MEVIPVIDLFNGQAVHAVRGERTQYGPVKSCLCASSDPIDLAIAYRNRLDAHSIYVADLNGILENSPDWRVLSQLTRHAKQLWVDAGCAHVDHVKTLVEQLGSTPGHVRIVLPLERIESLAELGRMIRTVKAFDWDYVFSVDMKDGKSLAGDGWGDRSPREIVIDALGHGIDEFLLLDLAQVGSGNGVREQPVVSWASEFPDARFSMGGGIRARADLNWLRHQGWQAALVATAIHQGVVDRACLAAMR